MKQNYKRTEETRKKMSESQKKRYERETPQQKEKRINSIKSFYQRANALMMEEKEREREEAHRAFIMEEYERLKSDGVI